MFPNSLNNPVLEELDGISPEAKQAIIGAHQHVTSQMGQFGMQPASQITPGSGPPVSPAAPTPAATPAPSLGPPASSGLMHSAPPTPVQQPDAQGLANREKLNKLQNTGSGVSQIHNPWARIPLQIAGAIGQAYAPGIEQAIPGTEGHHQLLVQRAKARVGEDESLMNNEQKRRLEAAQTTAAASTPDYRQGVVQNKAAQVQATEDLGQSKIAATNARALQNYKAHLAKDGYTVDPDTGDPRPMKPEEMSDPQQANLALKRAQTEYEGAQKEYKQAQTANIPEQMHVAQQKMELTPAAPCSSGARFGVAAR